MIKKGKIAVLILSHVDDVLSGSGTSEFKDKVLNPLRRRFIFEKKRKKNLVICAYK